MVAGFTHYCRTVALAGLKRFSFVVTFHFIGFLDFWG